MFQQLYDTAVTILSCLLKGDFASIKRLTKVNALFDPRHIHHNFTHMRDLFFHTELATASATPVPIPTAPKPLPIEYNFRGTIKTVDQWRNERNVSALLVIKDGVMTHESYAHGTSEQDIRISWSMSKSVLSLTLGALIDKGIVPESALDEPVTLHVPSLVGSGYVGATLRQVLWMSSGVLFNEDYLDYNSDINRMGRVLAIGGSLDAFAASLGPHWRPGTYSHYVSIDTHVIGMVIRAITKQPLASLLMTHIFEPLGMEADMVLLTDSTGEPFILGGLNMRSRDYARIGLMVLNNGRFNNQQIVSEKWIKASTAPTAPPASPEKAPTEAGQLQYGYQWWIPTDHSEGECFAIGIYGQYIYINPTYQTVIVCNSGDVNFMDGEGLVTQENIALFRTIAKTE